MKYKSTEEASNDFFFKPVYTLTEGSDHFHRVDTIMKNECDGNIILLSLSMM